MKINSKAISPAGRQVGRVCPMDSFRGWAAFAAFADEYRPTGTYKIEFDPVSGIQQLVPISSNQGQGSLL